jgi:hypothetical protein
MTTRKDIYALIPTDELHWNESEKNFVALSEEEIDKIILQYVRATADFNVDNIHKVVQAMVLVKVSKLLFDRFASGHIRIDGIDEDNNIKFASSNE